MSDSETLASIDRKLESIDVKVNRIDVAFAGISPVILEHGRRLSKVEDLTETLRMDVNAIATMQREVKAQYILLAGIIAVCTPIVSVFVAKWVG